MLCIVGLPELLSSVPDAADHLSSAYLDTHVVVEALERTSSWRGEEYVACEEYERDEHTREGEDALLPLQLLLK